MGIKAFIINLDHKRDRWKFISDQISSFGQIEFERISAVNAQEFDPTDYSRYGWRDYWELSRGQAACFESHKRIWRRIVNDNIKNAVILEDDVLISSDFERTVLALKNLNFDLVKLDASPKIGRFGRSNKFESFELRSIKLPVSSSASYFVSLAGCQNLLKNFPKYLMTVDDYLFTSRKNNCPFQLLPAMSIQLVLAECTSLRNENGIDEKIVYGNIEKSPVISRGPIIYRLMKEFRRTYRRAYRTLVLDRKIRSEGGLISKTLLAKDLRHHMPPP